MGSFLPWERDGDEKKLHSNTLASSHLAVGKQRGPFFVSVEELVSAIDDDSRVVEIKQPGTSAVPLFSVG